jgi:hypothetical protein
MIPGEPAGKGYFPLRSEMSMRFNPNALILTMAFVPSAVGLGVFGSMYIASAGTGSWPFLMARSEY